MKNRPARVARILSGLDLKQLAGIEVGALDRPLVRRGDGPVIYVDHVDTPALREKYAKDPNITAEKIVDVGAVWGERSISEAVGRQVDYVVASHVIEHVPDLIGWLQEIHDVLRSDGQLRLAVPDRRYTFDFRRRESRLADVLNAWLLRARKPLPHAILDFALNAATIDPLQAWQCKAAEAKPWHGFDAALAMAREALEQGTYHDVHCWVFTPVSFAELMRRLVEAGLVGFSCLRLMRTEPGDLEFIAHLKRCDDPAVAAASWRSVLDAERDHTAGDGRPVEDRDEESEADKVRAECDLLRHQLEAILNSRSWRITAPLRAATDRLRRRG